MTSSAYSWELNKSLKAMDRFDYEKISEKKPQKRSKKEKEILYNETTKAGQSISEASIVLQRRMNVDKSVADRTATLVVFASEKYNIDPRIMLSIIKVESDFNQTANNKVSCKYKRETNKSRCGDHSIAQINYHIWKDVFLKKGRKPLDFNRLKNDDSYAIFRMAEILDILKEDYQKKDKHWYARYHSSTPKLKENYRIKVDKEFSKIKSINPEKLFESIVSNN